MSTSKSFYFSDGPYLQVMQSLHAALSMPEALIKLVGNPHTGKSLLCKKFCQFLQRKDFHVIYFGSAIESPDILRGMLAREFDLPESSNFARLLEDALRLKSDKPVVLIFDDAHLLTDVTLLEIYRLAEVQVDSRRMLNIVLCGELSLEKRLLSKEEFKSLLLQVSHRFLLEPMDLDELGRFFYRFVDKAGLPGLQLDQSAMNAFYKASKGYPGAALNMCQLLVASHANDSDLSPISKEEFQKLLKQAASAEVMPSTGYFEQYRQFSKLGPAIPMAAVLIIASLGFLYQQLSQNSNFNGEPSIAANLDSNLESPFAAPIPEVEEEALAQSTIAEPNSISEDIAAPAQEIERDLQEAVESEAAESQIAAFEIDEPVSDSSLALVTAQERGVGIEAISIPEFEEMLAEAPELEEERANQLSVANVNSDAAALNEEDSTEDESGDQSQAVAMEEAPVEERILLSDSGDQAEISEVAIEVINTELEPVIEIEDELNEENNATDSELLNNELKAAVDLWVAAWQDQSMPSYFASYHSDFSPRYQDTQSAWRSNRERVIGGADWIRLNLSEFEFIGEEEGMLEVRFWLRYESPSYSDSTQKKLLMLQEQGSWKIKEEINLQVRS